ncbi:MAG: hypothetical protein GY701_02615 [Sulfitobacter sp.]|nr:hypothetical protein [Sulfitobacter sp.]
MPKSNSERADPDGLGDELTQLGGLLDNPAVTALLEMRGVNVAAQRNSVREGLASVSQMSSLPDRVLVALTPLGWASFGGMPTSFYEQAVERAESGDTNAAERILVEGWNEGDRLETMTNRVRAFPILGAEDWAENLQLRHALLKKALVHHRNGSYEASVPIVLAQIDGLMFDLAGRGWFWGKTPPLEDDRTLAGHPDSVAAVRNFLHNGNKRTVASGSVGRHGVVHGTELAYDTLLNSTKVFVALFAFIEVAQQRAHEKSQAEAAARVEQHAGTGDVDDDGRQLDRREFDETKMSLMWIASAQERAIEERGEPKPTISADVESRIIERLGAGHAIEMEVDQSSGRWAAWRRTVSGWVLGVGGRPGDNAASFYDGPEPPDLDGPWPQAHNW